jgi:hypothetical protein
MFGLFDSRRETADLRAENSAKDTNSTVDMGFHGSNRLIENLSNLRVAAALDEAQGRSGA